MDTFIVLDLETTGFSPSTCDIIEVGAWKVVDGVVKDKFSTLIRPVVYIPRQVQELTGITMDDVKDCETIETVLIEFFDWCGDLPFLGYNLSFDFNFLMNKGKALGLDFSLKCKRDGIDVMSLAKKTLSLTSYKLVDVCESLNLKIDTEQSFHRAEYDAYMTKLIYDRLLLQYSGIQGVKHPSSLVDRSVKYGTANCPETLSFE